MVIATSRDGNKADQTAAAPTAGVTRTFTIRDLLVSAFYHRRVIIIAALIPFVMGILLALATQVQYTSSGLLMVLVNRDYSTAQNVTDSGPAVLSIEGLKSVEAEVLILESAEVIRATIAEVGEERLFPPSLLGTIADTLWRDTRPNNDQELERFRKQLRASVQQGSNVVLVSFTNPDRNIAAETTDALIRNYLARRKVLFDNPTSKILVSQVEQLEARLRETDATIRAEMASANIIEIAQDLTLAANQADSILQRWRQVHERRRAVDGQLLQAREQQKRLSETVFDFRQRSNEASLDGDVGDLLVRLRTERQTLISQYAPNHPRIKEIDAKIKVVLDAVKNPQDRTATTERDVRNPSVAFLSNMILSLQVEEDALDQQIKELEEQKKRADERIGVLRDAEGRLRVLQRERAVLTEAHREYVKRAEAARIEEAASSVRASNVRIIQSGRDDIVPRNLALAFLSAGLLAGILSGAAAGVIASELRPGFIRQEDAERTLGLPALAAFSNDPDDFDGLANHQTMLSLVARLMDIRIIGRPISSLQLVDVSAPEDKASLTKALAMELSAGRKLRTLVIGLSITNALERISTHEVLERNGILVTKTSTPGLDIASVNEDSPLIDLRSSSEQARETILQLRDNYDVVLISYPASSIHLARRFAAAVDASVLVIRAEHSRSPVATWTRDNIFDAGGGIAGFVFTGRKFYLPEWIYRWL
ncbi:GumC family protein [Pseudochelatococcus sp. G4_1912]|uniref:GumC family protein n=1 Tax=Pseudochelatococcus sp. G4_1912 TaxID=3114288 RepID=UPI0039C62801